jgi:hypothetical protein
MTRDQFAAEALKGLLLAEAMRPAIQDAGPPAKGELRGDAALVARAFALADEMVKTAATFQYPYGVVSK